MSQISSSFSIRKQSVMKKSDSTARGFFLRALGFWGPLVTNLALVKSSLMFSVCAEEQLILVIIIDSHRMRRLSTSSDSLKEVRELRDLAQKQLKQNLEKYSKFREIGLATSLVISSPTISNNNDLKPNEINLEKQYLEGVLNKLMKDAEALSKQERKYIYEVEQENQDKRDMDLSVHKSYNYLRSAWTQFTRTNPEQIDDHLERLNKTVAVLKGNIQKSHTTVKSKKSTFYTMQELMECEEYQTLLKNYEEVQMELEDTTQRYESRLVQIQQKNRRLEEENKNMKRELQDFKCREILQSTAMINNRPNIITSAVELKPLFQNPYFQVRIMKIPSDDSSYYSKCLNDLKEFVGNYTGSEQSIKEQRATAIKNLHQFARSQDITKVKYERMKPVAESDKVQNEKVSLIEKLRAQKLYKNI